MKEHQELQKLGPCQLFLFNNINKLFFMFFKMFLKKLFKFDYEFNKKNRIFQIIPF